MSDRAMQVAGSGTMLRTAQEQGVSAELISPYMDLLPGGSPRIRPRTARRTRRGPSCC
ncbi:hypothetical protein [Streptomyces xanthophaeus]|uniref:hypothetical protein n=1 Tax=Streptomyces xanthophaeus TaxID=67385 RepID=UPI0026494325|nr:hypothetical protein [Streptomyces xanthophaeus]WKD34796.1 hypothetical protein KO717_24550 [Streptomyces xanthophaeus]